MEHCYKYPRPALTTDSILFGYQNESLHVLLIERGIEPFKGQWAFPGGFVNMDETTEAAARRELYEETNLKNIFMEQLYTFSDVDRDPRGRVISIAYFALINMDNFSPKAGDDAAKTAWFSINNLPELAFDHQKIVEMALIRLRGKIRYEPIGFELLPTKFTLTELQKLYEAILEKKIDKRNFRKKILSTNLLLDLNEKQKGVAHKPAKLYKFDQEQYLNTSLNFEL